MSQRTGAKIPKVLPTWYAIFLKFTPESFEPINALRAKHFNPTKKSPTYQPFPSVRLYNNLPNNLAATYRNLLPGIAAGIAPFRVPVEDLQILKSTRKQIDYATREAKTIEETTAVFGIPHESIEHVHAALRGGLRDMVVADARKRDVPARFNRADPMKPKETVGTKTLKVRGWLDETKAKEIVEDVKQTHPDGIGPLVAEGIVLSYIDMARPLKGEEAASIVAEFKFGGSAAD
jgi:hypothetical protein